MKLADFELADSFLKRTRGLMFRRRLEKPLLFVFDRNGRVENAIHSFFVFVKFDAVFLDEEKKVVSIHERIKPFTPLVIPKAHTRYLIEAPAGWAKKKKIKLGEKIEFTLKR